jgi:hypothetical protein
MYYVFSAYYEDFYQTFRGDFFLKFDDHITKSRLKEVVRESHDEEVTNIVILGITKMTEEEFKIYWAN